MVYCIARKVFAEECTGNIGKDMCDIRNSESSLIRRHER